jgi:OOP family OmpA-OmpF porin
MPTTTTSPFTVTEPVISYVFSILLWLTLSIGSGLLIVWNFIDSRYEVPSPFSSYQSTLPVIPAAPEKPAAVLARCEQSVNSILKQQTVHFNTGSARLSKKGQLLVQQVADLLRPCQHAIIAIKGHTDNVGTEEKNMSLSLRRAKSVEQALRPLGYRNSKFTLSGAGETQPIADNNTPEGRYQNRRIEIRLREQIPSSSRVTVQ